MSEFDPTQFNWTKPDYKSVFEFRLEALAKLRKHPTALENLMQYYAVNWADFITDWGMTYDPREPKDKYFPFILFPRQVEFVNWVYESYIDSRRGLGEKSRDVGFTWLCAACAACVWLFFPSSVVGFGSRKKELVDNGDHDPDSIFWKVRAFIDYLPAEFLHPQHTAGRKWGTIPNPANNSVIKGEIGDEIGRGGRAGLYFVDEFAHLEHPDMAESALSATTNCRIYISTVNGIGNLFYRLRHFLPKEQIFIFDWKDDPRKRQNPELLPDEEPWYKKQKIELLPTTLASQVDRNYAAAVSNTLVNHEKLKEATLRRPGSITQPDSTPWKIGVDAAGMGNDEIIIWARRGRMSIEPETYKKLDGLQLATLIEYKVKRLLNTGPVDLISIERDGPGGSAADQLKYGPYASIVRAVHTGAKLADGKNYNLRAYLHSQAIEYIEDLEISLPDDAMFIAQATAIQFEYKGGLLLIESKDDYRARFAVGRSRAEKHASKSPDRWDAFVLTFVPTRAKAIKSANDNAGLGLGSGKPGWRPLDAVMGY
jgi:phage terminase large subunit